MFKKVIALLLAGALISGVFSGCGILKKKSNPSPSTSASPAPYIEEPASTDSIGSVAGEKIYATAYSYFYDVNFRTLMSKVPQASITLPTDATSEQKAEIFKKIIEAPDSTGINIKQKARDLALVECQTFITDYVLAKRNGYKLDEAARKTLLDQMNQYLISNATDTKTQDMVMVEATGMNIQDYKRFSEYYDVKGQYDNSEVAKITSTDADLKAYYDANVNKFRIVSVRQTLLSINKADAPETKLTDAEIATKKAKANTLLKLIKDGTLDAMGIAKGYSEDTGLADNAGLYDVTSNGTYVAEFQNWALKQTEVNVKNSEIVETTYGFHIMTVEKIDTYDSSQTIKDTVKAAYLQEKYDAILKNIVATDEFKLTDVNNSIIDTTVNNYITYFIASASADAAPSDTAAQ